MENLFFYTILVPGLIPVFYYLLRQAQHDYNNADCPEMKYNAAVGVLGSILALILLFITTTYIVAEWIR